MNRIYSTRIFRNGNKHIGFYLCVCVILSTTAMSGFVDQCRDVSTGGM